MFLVRRLALGLLVTLPLAAQSLPDLHWRMVGPFRGGRTRAATGVPGQPNVFYIGQVNGGVWKSTDYGRTWNPIFDGQGTQSIGAIAVAPSNSDVLYVASGEGLHRPDLSVGDGIYKSTDAGRTWSHLGLQAGQQIPALAIDPRDPNRLFAAVLGHPYGPNEERGIYRSVDGGVSWKKVLSKSPNIGGSDVTLDPVDPNIVYASLWESRLGPWEDGNQYDGAGGGLFKSTDGGETWKQLKKGLPDDLSHIQIAIAPSDPKRIYATISTTKPSGYANGAGVGFYRSDDAGESWYSATDDPRPAEKIGGGDLPIAKVDPRNPDVVYSASIVTHRSVDGGKTWESLRGAPGGDDYQNLWINPTNPDIILLVSDQGAIVTVNRGESWSSWYNQPTAQLYHVALTNEFPYKLCAGQQESGSVCISSRGNDGSITFRDWHPAGIIEYGYAAPDPLHPEIVFGAGRTEVSKYNMVTGQVQNITPVPAHDPAIRADRTEPIMFSPLDPHLLFYASNVLFETKDYGASWQKISPDLSREHTGQPASLSPLPAKDQDKRRGAIYSLAPSYKSPGTIWAGTDDGLLWITRDHGAHWKNITPAAVPAWSKVTQISASHFDDATAYVSVSGLRIDDLHPYLFRTHDAGATWQPIATGLPDSPVNTVREDPVRKGLLFAGTETAVWVSLDDGDHWQSLQLNLPHTSMRDLWVGGNSGSNDDLIVATHGRGFWILDGIAPLRQIPDLKPGTATLFKPGDAYRIRRSTNTDTPLPIDEPAGENPPDGAMIDYALPASTTGPVTLEVLDSTGKLMRKFSSDDKPYATPAELAKQLIPLYWLQPQQSLPATPGFHRWIWDLRATTPTATDYEYPIAAVPHRTPRTPQGPLVLPGTYKLRLTANGQTLISAVTVKMDPRVKITSAELLALNTSETKLAAMVTSSSEADLEAHSIREQIEKLSATASPDLKASLEKTDKDYAAILSGSEKTSAKEESPGLDDLSGESSALYAEVGQSDAPPTAAQLKAVAHTSEELAEVLAKWKALRSTSLPLLNQKLQAAHLPLLNPEQRPENMPQSGDED
jgi:photosystem II stability/assembly factor-like uncharacterized protein